MRWTQQLKICSRLFVTQFLIGTFTFGGGYVILPMLEKYYVKKSRLLTEEELLEMAAVAQSSPGAIAVNLSVLAGCRIAGWKGALISGIASLLPSLIILSLVTVWYEAFAASVTVAHALKGMQAGVSAVILAYLTDMVLRMKKNNTLFFISMAPMVFLASTVFHINIAWILVCCCILCILKTALELREGKKV